MPEPKKPEFTKTAPAPTTPPKPVEPKPGQPVVTTPQWQEKPVDPK